MSDPPRQVYTPPPIEDGAELLRRIGWHPSDMKRPSPMIAWDYVNGWTTRLGPEVQQAWEIVQEAAEEAVRRGP